MAKHYSDLSPDERDWLKKEYELLQEIIGRHDKLCFQLKGWGITVWSGLTGYFLTHGELILHGYEYLVSAIIIIVFFILECSYSVLRGRAIRRVEDIEKFLKGEYDEHETDEFTRLKGEFKFPSIDCSLRLDQKIRKDKNEKCKTERKEFCRAFRRLRITLPYYILISVSLLLFLKNFAFKFLCTET